MLDVGAEAPSFTLPGCDGSGFGEYSLEEYTATGAVVLLFYPFDFSPVCTGELCEFRDAEWLTVSPDVDVLGISTDSAFAHRQLVREYNIPFPLLSDGDGRVSEAYGVLYDELEGHPLVSKRAVFVVDDRRRVRYAWEADDWRTDPNVLEVSETVDALRCVN